MPQISVIMPVYNTKEEYLREAIESILNQTFKNFELIIVDNGSKPYVAKILNSYRDKRIKIYTLTKNVGPANGRNYALSKSSGKYVAILDSDDISLPDRLQKQYDFLEHNTKIGCLGTKTKVIGDKLSKNMCFHAPDKHDLIKVCLLFSGCCFCHSSIMLRKKVLDQYKISYKDEYVPAEDYALYLDLIGNTEFAVLDEKLAIYRSYKENISNQEKEKQFISSVNARLGTWIRFCNVKDLDIELWRRFCTNYSLSKECMSKLNKQLQLIIHDFGQKGYQKGDIIYYIRKRFRKQYYKTKNFKGQLALWRSPWNSILRISLSFRLFCLITRGIL